MDFYEVLDQVIDLLRSRGRVTYRALKRQFDLDDNFLEDLKDEIIKAQQLAVDENSEILVWTGETEGTSASTSQPAQTSEQPLAQQDQPTQADSPPPEPPTPDAERRQLTVMFCDLADSTHLSGQLDPEDLRDVIRAYQSTSAEVIERFDGHIAQHLGDGLMVYFGWPQAHEDDAQRAVHAGLGILEAMQGLNVRLGQDKGIRLAVRIGIHTGLVVVGEIGKGASQEHLALGETPNIASRIEGVAEPDTVAISDATYQLVQGYFVDVDLGHHTLKGVDDPQQVYRVVGGSGAQSRLDIVTTRGLTPLVGREQETGLLVERWQQVTDDQGQVVLLSGEAGIGKSRLIQETAYQSLLKRTRQQMHQQIAQVLTERFPETEEMQPELLAHHYTEAGLNEQSVVYWHKAGQRAIERSADLEAVSHLTKGLESLKTLPDTSDRARQELTLQRTLGPPLSAVKGFQAPEVETVYLRAQQLCQHLGDTQQLFPVLFGLWGVYFTRGKQRVARELAEQLLDLAQPRNDPALLLQAHLALGHVLYMRGDFVAALRHLEQGIDLYDPGQHREYALRYGVDPGVSCRAWAAQTLWMLGYPDRALCRSHEALTLAQTLSHSFSMAAALNFGIELHGLRRDWPALIGLTEQIIPLVTEQGYTLWARTARRRRGWAWAMLGHVEEGIVQYRQHLLSGQA
ncbi:MAG: AAA family ATPase, partial [bacterium]|nr:AAA family ATPase [bacterium]